MKFKKIKQPIGDIFDDIVNSIFIEATRRQEIAHSFGKVLKTTCERIHFSNVAVSSLQFYLKWTVSHILLKIVPIFYSFCKTLQIDDFKVSKLMVKTSQLNLFLDKLALMLLYFLIYCQGLKILSRHYFRTSNFLNILDKSTGY